MRAGANDDELWQWNPSIDSHRGTTWITYGVNRFGGPTAMWRLFLFNGTTGERTAEKGFEEAPVIINGELQTGLGGGICQVSTTVFNAVYEAGLQIDERTNHSFYISHYPLGRDATVNYPDLDLKFTNDTDHWPFARLNSSFNW